jgi:hypothetical protein
MFFEALEEELLDAILQPMRRLRPPTEGFALFSLYQSFEFDFLFSEILSSICSKVHSPRRGIAFNCSQRFRCKSRSPSVKILLNLVQLKRTMQTSKPQVVAVLFHGFAFRFPLRV